MVEILSDISAIPDLLGSPKKILILGGIGEAGRLAMTLVQRGHDVTSSLAGRTKEPVPVAGAVRVGGFGGANGLQTFIIEHGFDVVIDATHPFARTISANAVTACEMAERRLIVYRRPSWPKQAGDRWIETDSLAAASNAIPHRARVLLALGSQHIAQFSSRDDVHFVVRMVDAPVEPLPLADFSIISGKPGDTVAETQLLMQHRISHIVCRNSGGVGAYAKIEAARDLNLPVIIINR
jgi:precorrin-6A/cobalt-precorrin-6A reductase